MKRSLVERNSKEPKIDTRQGSPSEPQPLRVLFGMKALGRPKGKLTSTQPGPDDHAGRVLN